MTHPLQFSGVSIYKQFLQEYSCIYFINSFSPAPKSQPLTNVKAAKYNITQQCDETIL